MPPKVKFGIIIYQNESKYIKIKFNFLCLILQLPTYNMKIVNMFQD